MFINFRTNSIWKNLFTNCWSTKYKSVHFIKDNLSLISSWLVNVFSKVVSSLPCSDLKETWQRTQEWTSPCRQPRWSQMVGKSLPYHHPLAVTGLIVLLLLRRGVATLTWGSHEWTSSWQPPQWLQTAGKRGLLAQPTLKKWFFILIWILSLKLSLDFLIRAHNFCIAHFPNLKKKKKMPLHCCGLKTFANSCSCFS